MCEAVATGRRGEIAAPAFIDGAYRSAPAERTLFARALPGLRFYSLAGPIVWRASRLAVRGAYNEAAWSRSSFGILRALEAAGIRLEIAGVGHFAALDGPCVFIGNHMSTLETFVLPTIILSFRPVTYVVKRELASYPVFGHIMRARDPVMVGRANPRDDLKAVLEGGAQRLRAGISIVVFPQTTRTPIFDPAAFNTIGVKLARRAQVPLVPIALKTDAWGNGRIVKDIGRIDPAKTVHIEFGAPLQVQGTGAVEHERVIDFIRGRL
ncbi:MAG TPA: lysophospholipid acyltransferase family protein, partial [Candidatus Methanoperedens sp.]|nr:lysophospholipid acyltransferase family protein [Candidatus Methanoperedens sp.]